MADLSSVVQITMGQAPAGSSYNTDGHGKPLIAGAGDFEGIKPKAKKFTTQPSKISEAGDIILGIRASIGEKVWSDGVYCLGRGVAGLRPGPKVNINYLWHWLDHSKSILASKGKGATFKQVNKQDIGELKIPLLPIPEQRRIAKILDHADALLAKRKRAIELLDELAQAVFLEMFGDPVVNEKGWDEVPLGEFGVLDRGVSKHRPRNDPSLLGGPFPLVQTGDVASSGGFINHARGSYSEQGLAQSKMWPVGTLCITIAANIAQTGILEIEACFPDSVVGFKGDRATDAHFVQHWMKHLRPVLERRAPQSAQKNINLGILRGLPIIAPPKFLRDQFSYIIGCLRSYDCRLGANEATLQGLSKSLRTSVFGAIS